MKKIYIDSILMELRWAFDALEEAVHSLENSVHVCPKGKIETTHAVTNLENLILSIDVWTSQIRGLKKFVDDCLSKWEKE